MSFRLPHRIVAGFAAGGLGTGGFSVLPGLVLAYYLTDSLAVSPLLAAVVVVAPKVVDIGLNPVIGARSDADAAATGSRTRLMWLGTVAIVPAFVLMFCVPPSVTPTVGAIWVLVTFTATAIAYSCFQVPYVALPADLTPDHHERTRLVATRIAVVALATLALGAGGPAIRDAVGGSAGYAAMAVTAGAVIATGMSLASATAARPARRQRSVAETDASRGVPPVLAVLREHSRYRIVLVAFIVQTLAGSVMLAGAQYFATYVLGDAAAIVPVFFAYIAPALVVMPLWSLPGRRWGKLRAFMVASILVVGGASVLSAAAVYPGAWVFVAISVAGIGYAGTQTFSYSILPDLIDERSAQTGRDDGGVLSGLWTAGETLGMAVGPGLYLLVLAASGFVASPAGVTVAQSGTALIGVTVGMSVLPAVLVAVSLFFLARVDRVPARSPDSSPVTSPAPTADEYPLFPS
ncbi:MFS transporter [Nocardia coubleae]|uniref:MFS transporter n=1 Tax=Nocardia coubleae TaxID=356147 RepID=A0A846W0M3_9NOCA|nr:MFS transporter [Nocardia coubleae]NKX86545.1 MFS transporter [Nocardia coubleae]